MVPHRRFCTFTQVSFVVLVSSGLLSASASAEKEPSELAKGGFRGDGGYSFRLEFADGGVLFQRTVPDLPQRGAVMPAWLGDAYVLFQCSPGAGAKKVGVEKNAWDHQVATYAVASGQASVILSRLTPAVLIDSPASSIAFEETAPTYVAFVSGGKVVASDSGDLGSPLDLDEPWMLGWFGRSSPYRNYPEVADLDDQHLGADKVSLDRRRPVKLDFPLLFRLEHRPRAVRVSTGGLIFLFEGEAGKIAVMPLFGGRIFEPQETEKWVERLPGEVLRQCRLWSQKLRDYPLSVRETFSSDPERDVLSIRQEFEWASFEDDWKSPPVKAAPVPPMLAVALGGNIPVTFSRGAKKAEPVDYNFMDIPGKAMGVEGADTYEFQISGLGDYLFYKRNAAPVSTETAPLRAKLEKHIQEMVDAGHLAPLFYVYGGIAGSAPAYFYWGSSPDLARAVSAAYPYLSESLKQQVKMYLQSEWRINPPFQADTSQYLNGANRAPYDVPWQDIRLLPAFNREKALRESRFFADLYGVYEYIVVTGEKPDAELLRIGARRFVDQLLALQDWALCGPVKPPITQRGFFDPYSYYRRNGQSTYNSWLAGSIGLVRLSRILGWKDEEALGWYLFGKLAMARIGQARYTAELHRMGSVLGDEKSDWRTLVHIDQNCAIVLRGSISSVVHEDQEVPPFIDLVEEVGRMLGRHARKECRIYLDNLDESMPLWWISEAPKQSASEHRLCPLQHKSGNVLAQCWILGKTGEQFRRYVDTTRFKGDLFYIHNLAALIDSYAEITPCGIQNGLSGTAPPQAGLRKETIWQFHMEREA